MAEASYLRPVPKMEPEAVPYWAYLREHRMHIQHCQKCGQWFFPPSTHCPGCLDDQVRWEPVAGSGKVWATVTMHQLYRPAYKDDIPYNVSIVKLDEGARVWTNVIECAPGDVHVGMAVRVRYDDVAEDLTLARFVPA